MQDQIQARLERIVKMIHDTHLDEAERELASLKVELPEFEISFVQMILHSHQGRYRQAFEMGEQLLQTSAVEEVLVRFHQGRNCIAVGEWKRGLALLDSVRGSGVFGGALLTAQKPLWSGENLRGRTLLLACEGGLGDAICFSRFVSQLDQLGAKVILAGYEPIFSLLRTIPGVQAIVDLSVATKCDFDFWLPALSAPRMLNLDFEQISGKPFIRIPPGQAAKWQALVRSSKIKVGICWQGNPEFQEDYVRSIPGELFGEILDLPSFQFYKVQVNAENNSVRHNNLIDLTDQVQNPEDLSGFLSQMDVFVSVDSGMAHLAGALGVPVILLNRIMGWFTFCHKPDHQNPQRTPWYDSMLVLHQKRWGQWAETVQRLKEVLIHQAWPAKQGDLDEKIYHPLNPTPSPDLIRYVDSRLGPFLTVPNDYFVGQALDVYGEYAYHESRLFDELLKPGDVVVEAGSHLGAHTVKFGQLVQSQGQVYAFEPQSFLRSVLQKNLALQSLSNVKVFSEGLAERAGTAQIPQLDYTKVGNFGALEVRRQAAAGPTEEIRLISLDELNLSRLHFVKMDIEGMELEALRGASKTVQNLKPILYIENDRAEKSKQLTDWLLNQGYQLWSHRPFLFHENNFKKNPTNIYGDFLSSNILAVPKGQPLINDALVARHSLTEITAN